MSSPSVNRDEIVSAMRRSLKDHWKLFLTQGILLVVLGALAVIVPVWAAFTTSIFVGWILFFAGAMRAISLIRSPHAPGYLSSLILAILMAILGLVLALFPIAGASTLALFLVAYFIVHGIASFIFAFSVKGDTSRWLLLVFSGIIDLVLAGLALSGGAATSVFVLGLYVGINLLFTGLALAFAALGARSA